MKDQKNQDDSNKPSQTNPAMAGRNSNDDFNDEQVDDYGIDKDDPEAEEKIRERDAIKGGEGSQSGNRNSNDNFEDK